MAGRDYYESERTLSEYLLLHYGQADELAPPGFPAMAAANFPARCVNECVDLTRVPASARALDLGCAVGRATFELARHCGEVIGIDHSGRFIAVASQLAANGSMMFGRFEEGDLTQPCQAVVPPEIDRGRARFERGDAMQLADGLGDFDVVLMANLIDRLREPRKCLARLPHLLKPGGQLVITSPYTWLEEYTLRENWLGGFTRGGRQLRTLDALKTALAPHFEFARSKDLPFVIREHSRKFQYVIAEAGVWVRKGGQAG